MSDLSQDELTIETLRYRAPVVVPLAEGDFAVLCPGWDQPIQIVTKYFLHETLTRYIEWNQLAEAKAKTLPRGVVAIPLDDVVLLHDTLKEILGE